MHPDSSPFWLWTMKHRGSIKLVKYQTWRGLTYSRLMVWLCVTLKPPAQRPSHPLGSLTLWPGTHQYAQCEPSVRPGRYCVVDSLQHAHDNQWGCLFKATVSVLKAKVNDRRHNLMTMKYQTSLLCRTCCSKLQSMIPFSQNLQRTSIDANFGDQNILAYWLFNMLSFCNQHNIERFLFTWDVPHVKRLLLTWWIYLYAKERCVRENEIFQGLGFIMFSLGKKKCDENAFPAGLPWRCAHCFICVESVLC